MGGIDKSTKDKEFKAKYTELINNINLKAIDLLELNCIQDPQITVDHYTNKSDGTADISVSAKSDFSGYKIENNNLICFPALTLISNNEEKEVFSVKIKYSVIYTFDRDFNDIEDGVVEKFLEKNLPINIWPYMRELISSITVKMGYPPLILPVYKSDGM